ncbi:MAG: L,D-transpeptidase family protein [Pseudomonadota bacterium]
MAALGKLGGMAVSGLAIAVSGLAFAQADPNGAGAQSATSGPATSGIEAEAAADPIVLAIQEALDTPGQLVISDVRVRLDDLSDIYQADAHAPLWVGLPDADERIDDVLALFQAADLEGLDPRHYFVPELNGLRADDGVEAQAAFDILLTHAVLRYGSDIHTGRVAPSSLSRDFDFDRRSIDPAIVAIQAATAADTSDYLLSLAPSHQDYDGLRDALVLAREWVDQGGWPTVPDTPTLRPGERSSVVPALRARLEATGEYVAEQPVAEADREGSEAVLTLAASGASEAVAVTPTAGIDETLFDDALAMAVERFQEANGLAVDGVVGPRTLAAMNVTADQRVDQIVATMERWRWLPADLGDRYIMVNVPDYTLDVVDQGLLVRSMDVIVGRRDRQTPLFSSALTYMEFNPTWTVPTSIAINDFLPRLIEDPSYLRSQNIRAYSGWHNGAQEILSEHVDWSRVGTGIRHYMLRQAPGPGNSLGRVKFMMANNFSVYLHDTPSRSLFGRAHRSFSSGCVRVQDPMWLADYLLHDLDSWSAGRRESILATGRTTRVNMPAAMPLHLVYHTAWLDRDGNPVFREDIYGVDRMVTNALDDLRPERIEVALAG